MRRQGAESVTIAVPVASADTCHELRDLADDVVCLVTPEPFHAVGAWYDDFSRGPAPQKGTGVLWRITRGAG